jgi:hypothetical protein
VEQALDAPLLPAFSDLPAPRLKQEKSLCTFFDEQAGHFTWSDEPLEISSSKVSLHLAHSYSNMGKLITPIASPTIS